MIVRARLPILLATLLTLLLSAVCWAKEAAAPSTGKAAAYQIAFIKMEQTADDFQLRITGNAPPTYTMYELFDPLRVIIDVADASLADNASLPTDVPQGPILQVNTQVLSDQEPTITRIEIVLAEDRGYSVERQNNDILIAFAKEVKSGKSASARPAPSASLNAASSGSAPLMVQTATSGAPASVLYDIAVDTTDPVLTRVAIKTDGAIAQYKKAQLKKVSGRPDRMYIDIPNINLPGNMLQQHVGTALGRVRAAQRNGTVRIVFDSGLDELFAYDIQNLPDGLLVTITEPAAADSLIASLVAKPQTLESATEALPENAVTELLLAAGNTEELIKPIIPKTPKRKLTQDKAQKAVAAPVGAKKTGKASQSAAPSDVYGFAGYQKQKISVDFFKIDLHNVFRLFGEISGQNIVVDEAVSGTLTLALNEVPWDFALDIILNLKDLQKEERFNTIVISPKAKQFLWPKTATENIAFKADGGMEKLEAISVKERLETPKGVVEAKNLIRKASALDKQRDYAAALPLYEKAFALWPDNSLLAGRMAGLCLVHLGMNAKAVHYAKAALAADPANHNAALQAAIALANMKKVREAKAYFDIAISGEQPAREALLSYAAFAEEYNSFNGAIALLNKHAELFGDALDSMIAKARCYDKMGNAAAAVEEYRTILLSGYELPADLQQYIKGRIAAAENM